MNQKKPKLVLSLLALIGIVAAVLLIITIAPNVKIPNSLANSFKTTPGYYRVIEVYDGDTIAVNMDGRVEKVRMIGVDTPETHKPNSPIECGGLEASKFTKKQLNNKQVKLESDPTNQNRDRYERLLRYVYSENGVLFNKLLISEGYGTPYTSFPFQKKQEFVLAGQQAKLANKGVWAGECTIEEENGRFKTNSIEL